MNDQKLNAIMEVFAGLDHGQQVDLFLAVKNGLLQNRQCRREEHAKIAEAQAENIKALDMGNELICGNQASVLKA